MAELTMREILETARGIYGKTQHATGCCGDIDGVLEYIDGAVGEMVQGMINVVVDTQLTAELTVVGLNGWGDVVLHCKVCEETYAKKVQGKNMLELETLRQAHKCEKIVEAPRPIDRYRRPIVDLPVVDKIWDQNEQP